MVKSSSAMQGKMRTNTEIESNQTFFDKNLNSLTKASLIHAAHYD